MAKFSKFSGKEEKSCVLTPVKNTMEDKLKLQSRVNERYHDQIFEEIQELEQKKSEEALLMVQRSTIFGDIE